MAEADRDGLRRPEADGMAKIGFDRWLQVADEGFAAVEWGTGDDGNERGIGGNGNSRLLSVLSKVKSKVIDLDGP